MDADIYLFASISGGIECCACKLAPLVNTIFTKGGDFPLFGKIDGCEKCNARGCESCQMHDNTTLPSYESAMKHTAEHRKQGHHVPSDVDDRLRQEMEAGESLAPQ